jgi:hypothetical protein
VKSDFTSRTARVPTRYYKRRLTISEHAIERFRERVDEEFRHRDDEDLANLLDERLSYAEFTYQVDDPRAPNAVTTIRSVACRHATYYAVVREDTAITVLDEEMARNNFEPWIPVLVTPQGLKLLASSRLPALPAASVQQALPAPNAEDPAAPVTVGDQVETEAPAAAAVLPADPLAEAGVAYARARRHQHACEAAVAAIKAELDRATEVLLEAELAVEDTHRRLLDLAGRGDP